MSIDALVRSITDAGVRIRLDGEKLLVKIPESAPASIRKEIVEHKEAIKDYLHSITTDSSDEVTISAEVRPGGSYPLSFSQHALWLAHQFSSNGAEYNIPVRYSVTGSFDVSIAEQAFKRLIDRHTILRTTYSEEHGKPRQKILEFFDFSIDLQDFSTDPEEVRNEKVAAYLEADSNTAFDLSSDLMLRVAFLRLQPSSEQREQQGILVFNMHHIATDGWSMSVLVDEFSQLYLCLEAREEPSLKPLSIQYADFALWQRRIMDDDSLDVQKEYWKRQLADLPVCHSLPLDFVRPPSKQHEGARVSSQLKKELADRLLSVAKRLDVTPFILFHTALSLVFSRQSDCKDIVIGTPLANRALPQTQSLIGCLINVVALRVDTGFEHFVDLIDHVRNVHHEAQSNPDVSFEQIVGLLDLNRNSSHTSIIQIIMDTDNRYSSSSESIDEENTPAFTISPLVKDQYKVKFDLDLDIGINEQGVYTNWVYDRSLFGHEYIERMNDQLCLLLNNMSLITSAEGLRIDQLESVGAQDTTLQLHDFNQTRRDFDDEACIHYAFERQVLKTPDATAVVMSGECLSYKALNQRANQLAHYLIGRGICTEDERVGICLPPGIDVLVSILAILKAGSAYVPLDHQAPAERIKQIIDDSGVAMVIASPQMDSEFGQYLELPVLSDLEHTETLASGNPMVDSSLSSNRALAYVIYTSGSSGKPKGVMVEHRSVMNYLNHVAAAWLQSDVRGSIVSTSLSFDATVTTLLSPLMVGKSVEFISDSGPLLSTLNECLFSRAQAYLFKLTPAHLQALSAGGAVAKSNCVHRIVVGGDVFTSRLAKDWISNRLPKAIFVNEYGPTEATVGCNHYEVTADYDFDRKHSVDIGHAIQNTRLYVLDEARKPVPLGALGELYVSGEGLARGYLGQPALTEERFVDNPFSATSDEDCYQRMYRTGDVVRYVGGRNLGYIGRNDDQVKIRGYRIELGEVEQQITCLSDIESAVVLARTADAGSTQLAAFVRPHSGAVDKPSKISLLKQLASRLPSYMIPDSIDVVSEWPLTVNGKLDKQKLLNQRGSSQIADQDLPKTPTEKAIAAIWEKLLQRAPGSTGNHSEFLEVGGNSMMIFAMLMEINTQLGVKLSIDHVYGKLTIHALSEYADQLVKLDAKREALSTQEVETEGWL